VEALAGTFLQFSSVEQLDMPSSIPDNALILQFGRYLCNRRSSYTQHLAQKFLRERNIVRFRTIPSLEQPSTEPLFYIVERIAGRSDLSLRQDDLI
jgi:hypothetical protein